MSLATAFSRQLGLAAPIVQGPFGSGLSAIDLVVAVSEAGGLGSFGVHHLNGSGIREIAAGIRARTRRAFALNVWIPFENSESPHVADGAFARVVALLRPYYAELGVTPPAQQPERFNPPFAEQIEAVLEARPAVLSFVFGIPEPPILARCRELGITTLGTVTTVEEAIAMERAGVDAVVASGFEAGGHRISFLRPAEDSLIGTMALVPQVVSAVNVPVIAAGGIADGRGIAAALCLGAQAAQIGTAFLACDESGASAVHREQLHSANARHTALTRAFSGRLARGIRNRFIDETRSIEREALPYPVQAWLTGQFKQAAIAQQYADLLPLWSGQSASLIRHRKAGELFAALVRETSSALARVSGMG
jgi:nitronate monooxygenase